jgi:hypothetical protein
MGFDRLPTRSGDPKEHKPFTPIMQTNNSGRRDYQKLIQEATCASVKVLPILERILREEVFHSTLDWQTDRQFRQGAGEAYEIYRRDPAFFDAQQAMFAARWKAAAARMALEEVLASGPAEAVADRESVVQAAVTAEREAGRAFDHFLAPLCRTY